MSVSDLIHSLLAHDEQGLRIFFEGLGPWAYIILFAIVYGGIVTPVLPGDSALLVAGTVARESYGAMNPWLLGVALVAGALLADNTNYFLGSKLGIKLFKNEKSKFFSRKNLDRTHEFYEKYGGRTLLIGHFLPVIRTFAPLVAGMARMPYRIFMLYCMISVVLWVSLFESIGYFAAKWAGRNMIYVLLAIIAVSAIPAIFEFYRHWVEAKREKNRKALEAKEPARESA